MRTFGATEQETAAEKQLADAVASGDGGGSSRRWKTPVPKGLSVEQLLEAVSTLTRAEVCGTEPKTRPSDDLFLGVVPKEQAAVARFLSAVFEDGARGMEGCYSSIRAFSLPQLPSRSAWTRKEA